VDPTGDKAATTPGNPMVQQNIIEYYKLPGSSVGFNRFQNLLLLGLTNGYKSFAAAGMVKKIAMQSVFSCLDSLR